MAQQIATTFERLTDKVVKASQRKFSDKYDPVYDYKKCLT